MNKTTVPTVATRPAPTGTTNGKPVAAATTTSIRIRSTGGCDHENDRGARRIDDKVDREEQQNNKTVITMTAQSVRYRRQQDCHCSDSITIVLLTTTATEDHQGTVASKLLRWSNSNGSLLHGSNGNKQRQQVHRERSTSGSTTMSIQQEAHCTGQRQRHRLRSMTTSQQKIDGDNRTGTDRGNKWYQSAYGCVSKSAGRRDRRRHQQACYWNNNNSNTSRSAEIDEKPVAMSNGNNVGRVTSANKACRS